MQEPTQFNNGEGHWGWGKTGHMSPALLPA